MGLEFSRAGMRGLLCAAAFGLAASATGYLPVASSVYMGLLLAPTSLVERRLAQQGITLRTVLLAWFVLFGLVALMHLQAVYGSGVLSTGTLDGGGEALFLEQDRLLASAPGELGSLVGIKNVEVFASGMAGAAIALLCAALARPLALAKKMSVAKLWVLLAVGGLALGTLTVTAVIAWRDAGIIAFAYLVALFVAVDAIGPLVGTAIAWIFGGWAAERLLKLMRR